MVDRDEIARSLAERQPLLIPDEQDRRRAAVAMILREQRGGPEVLFIERAHHERDPWSGHMAFPGGRVDPVDPDTRAAAERETREEVGLRVDRGRHLGRLDDMAGRGAAADHRLVISGHVYWVDEPTPLSLDASEVESAFWFPLAALHDAARHVPYTIDGMRMEFPGILVGAPDRHVVWGLTYRFLEIFFDVLGHPLPPRPIHDPDGLIASAEDVRRSRGG